MPRSRSRRTFWPWAARAGLLVAFLASGAARADWWRPGAPSLAPGEAPLLPSSHWWPDAGAYPVARDAREAQRRHLEAAGRYLAIREYEHALHHYAMARGPLISFWVIGRPPVSTLPAPRAPLAPPAPLGPGAAEGTFRRLRRLHPFTHAWRPPGAFVFSRAISPSLAREAERGIARVADILHGPRRAVARALDELDKSAAGEAYAMLGRVPTMEAPEKYKAGYVEIAALLAGQIEREALATIETIEDALLREDDAGLRVALEEAQEVFNGFRDIPRALDAYRAVRRLPEFRARYREMEAEAALSAAERLVRAGHARRALAAFERIAEEYGDVESGRVAADRLADLRADPEFAHTADREEAQSLFSMALSFEMNHLYEQAAERYRRVTEEYPNTEEAAKAREALRLMEERDNEQD